MSAPKPRAAGASAARADSAASGRASADAIAAALPQTQCTRCGYPDCQRYAQAIAAGEAPINRCPPGGTEGVARLAALTGLPPLPLDAGCGSEAPRGRAVIDEAACIGCMLCIKACPVDCIVGAAKAMHTVIAEQCTGCELCIAPCPVDCIAMVDVSAPRTGWDAWSPGDAQAAQQRYQWRGERLARDAREHDARLARKAKAKLADLAAASLITDPALLDRKRALVGASIARAAARRQAAGKASAADADAASAADANANANAKA